jgi:hypothetical protein
VGAPGDAISFFPVYKSIGARDESIGGFFQLRVVFQEVITVLVVASQFSHKAVPAVRVRFTGYDAAIGQLNGTVFDVFACLKQLGH